MAEKIYGLLGRKLGHSWSPPIHTALGCRGYQLIEREPEELGVFLSRSDLGGINVTIPYKRDVMAYCDVIDEAAKAIGSVNTLVRRPDGKLYAWNTDAAGFRWMAERAGTSLAGKKVLILGSGGASLTAQAVSRAMGAREVVVVSRSGEDNYENLSRHADAEILVNTTPVGMYPAVGVSPVDLKEFPAVKEFWMSSTIPGAPLCCCRRRTWAFPAAMDFPCWWLKPRRQRNTSSKHTFQTVKTSGSSPCCVRK